MNQPAKTYISEYLTLEIKRFLMNTNLSIKEIAYQTGFEDPTNFVKFFKKHSNRTPAEFRKQHHTLV
jgi:AraC-like DNA-binding protein